jgi:hypothetical protein
MERKSKSCNSKKDKVILYTQGFFATPPPNDWCNS